MSEPNLLTKRVLGLAAAKAMTEAAEKAATAAGVSVVIAVVDDGANLLFLERMEGAPIGSLEVALRKAKSAALFKTETKAFEAGLASGASALLSLDLVAFEGGIPAFVNGQVAGAIGVSGGTASQDGEIARKGIGAISIAVGGGAA